MSEESVAEKLMARHAAAAATPSKTTEAELSSLASSTVSEVSYTPTNHDEDISSANSTTTSSPVLDPSSVNSSKSSPNKLDLRSLNAFPALGGSVTSSVPVPSSGSWAAKISANGTANGTTTNGTTNGAIHGTPNGIANGNSHTGNSPTDVATINKVKRNVISDNFTLRADRQVPNARAILPLTVEKAKRVSGATVDCSTNRMGHTSFVIKGKAEQVARAKRELLKELMPKVKKTIQIPADLRAIVIGSKGATLRPIIEKSGTVVDIGNPKSTKKFNDNNDNQHNDGQDDEDQFVGGGDDDDDDDEELVDVTIEGDEEGVKIASEEILAIVNSRVRDITAKIKYSDPRFAVFLKQKSSLPVKVSSSGDYISISGNQDTVNAVKADLESYIKDVLADFATIYIDGIPAAKFSLLNLGQILTQHGVLATAKQEPSSRIELFGPSSKLSEVKKQLVSVANSNLILSLDISKAHDKSQSHARNLVLFFKAYKKTKPIETTHDVVLTAEDTIYNIVGTDKEKIKTAKNELVALVNEYGPNKVRVLTDVSSFFSNQIKSIASSVKNVAVVLIPADGGVLLVYDPKKSSGGDNDNDDDFGPGSQEIIEALDLADHKFDAVREAQKSLAEQTFDVPKDEHKYILGPNGTTLRSIKGDAVDTIVELGTELAGGPNKVFIRGVKEHVDRIAKEIVEIIKESKDYEKLCNFTTEFKFPVAQISKLIGKQGANMTKLREEFGVKIEIDEEGNGIIKGFKKNAEGAKTRIVALGKKLEDETTLKMKVPNEYHATLIGTGGKFVRRLNDKYNVHIQFPRPGDGTNQDEVVIRGPSRGVEKTREEFDDLIKYEKDHSYTEVVKVPEKMLSRIIGRQGENITHIKDVTETRIDVPHKPTDKAVDNASSSNDAKVDVVVVGTKTGVKEAVSKLEAIVTELSDIVDEELEVDPKYHGLLIGPGGSTQREIVDKAGGTNYRSIQIPPAGDSSNIIKIHGNRKFVQKVIRQIKEIVDTREKQVTETVEVDPSRHGALIGRSGLTKQDLEHEFQVTLEIPRRGSSDESIKVTGLDKEKIAQAIERIKEITKANTANVKVSIPKRYRDELANKGAFFKILQSNYKVTVTGSGSGSADGKKQLVVDAPKEAFGESGESNPDGSIKYKFSVYPLDAAESTSTSSDDEGEVKWTLQGDPTQCAAAKSFIETTLEAIKQHDHRGYLWFADSSSYRFIIGPQGRTINKIRTESGCTITIPAANSGNAIIGMIGSEEQLRKAKDLILEAVQRH